MSSVLPSPSGPPGPQDLSAAPGVAPGSAAGTSEVASEKAPSEPLPSEPLPSQTVNEPVDYGASVLRTTIFCLLFLLLLPFFASLPMMIGMRASAGLLSENWGLVILAVAFAALMFLILVEMLFSIRTRVHLGREKVRMTLPAGRGPTPMLRYRSFEFPYDSIQSVETRREIYGGYAVPVVMKGARVNLKDGTVIPLGYVSEAEDDAVFPYVEIAAKIAERARLPLIDRGNVRRSVHRKLMGLKSAGTENDVVDEKEIDRLNRSHSTFMFALVGAIFVLMLIGIVNDFATGTPVGQTAAAAPR